MSPLKREKQVQAITALSEGCSVRSVERMTGIHRDTFVVDVAARMRNRVQVSADGLALYVEAVERASGAAVDFATIVETYEGEPIGAGRYAPPRVT